MSLQVRQVLHALGRGGAVVAACVALLLTVAAGSGCESGPAALNDAAAAADTADAHADSAAADSAAPDAGAPKAFKLLVEADGKHPVRLYVPVKKDGKDALLLLDTGSQKSFVPLPVGSPDWVPNAATVQLGDETLTLGGRPIALSESYQGLSVVGILGNDVLLDKPWEVDVVGGQLLRYAKKPDTAGWAKLSYENKYDFMFAWATIDGTKVRLGVDTGAPHTLWLGQKGRPGDVPVATQDAYGNPVTLYKGDSKVAFAKQPAITVPVLRTMSFPAIEDSNKQVGGTINGLLGLSALGARRILFDGAGSAVWLRSK